MSNIERLTILTLAGDQHEYCKSDISDSGQAVENCSTRKNTFQTQQNSDTNKVANRTDNYSIIQQVSKQIKSGGNSPGEIEKKQTSSPFPVTTISVGSSASTAIRAESNFDAKARSQSKQSVTVEKPITATISAVTADEAITAPLTSSTVENNNYRNISDLV